MLCSFHNICNYFVIKTLIEKMASLLKKVIWNFV